MDRIIVSVQRQGEAYYKDIEIPSGISGKNLSHLVAELFGWENPGNPKQVQYDIRADPPGRILQENEILKEPLIADGSRLTFIPRNISVQIKPDEISTENQPDAPAQPKTSFAWTEIKLD